MLLLDMKIFELMNQLKKNKKEEVKKEDNDFNWIFFYQRHLDDNIRH